MVDPLCCSRGTSGGRRALFWGMELGSVDPPGTLLGVEDLWASDEEWGFEEPVEEAIDERADIMPWAVENLWGVS